MIKSDICCYFFNLFPRYTTELADYLFCDKILFIFHNTEKNTLLLHLHSCSKYYSYSNSSTYVQPHSNSLTHTHTQMHTVTYTHTHTNARSLTHTNKHTHTHSQTHTHLSNSIYLLPAELSRWHLSDKRTLMFTFFVDVNKFESYVSNQLKIS